MIKIYSTAEKLYLYSKSMNCRPKCICGNDLKFITFNRGYRKYCSNSCSAKEREKSKLISEKRRQTKKKLYGDENYNNIEKMKQTNLEKYNHICSLHGKNKEKIENILIKKYGFDNVWKSPEIRRQIRKTKFDRYGDENFLNTSKISESLKNKIICSIFYGDRLKNSVEPLFKEEEFTYVKEKYKWKCKTCGNEFFATIDDGSIPRCYQCRPKYRGTSKKENEIKQILKEKYEIQENEKTIIYPLELDIYIDSLKSAIEFNRSYWHSTIYKDKWYHQYKIELCNRKGIRLLHIYEWNWDKNKQKCIEKIEKFLNSHEIIKIKKPSCVFIQEDRVLKYHEINFNKKYLKVWT